MGAERRQKKAKERATDRWMVESRYTVEVQREEGERRREINLTAEVRERVYATLERVHECVCNGERGKERETAIPGHRVGESVCV